jgi:hypothetical protein
MKLRTIDDPLVEAAARAMCAAEGQDPDTTEWKRRVEDMGWPLPTPTLAWHQYRLLAFRILVASEAHLLMMDE